jgi:hypothetical protein
MKCCALSHDRTTFSHLPHPRSLLEDCAPPPLMDTDAVLPSSTRAELQHFSPSTEKMPLADGGNRDAGGVGVESGGMMDLAAALKADVLRKKDATPSSSSFASSSQASGGAADLGPAAPHKNTHDGPPMPPPNPEDEMMPEEPDWDEIEALEREAMEAESYMDAPPRQQEMPDDLFGEQDEPRKRPLESGDGGYQQQQAPIQAAADDFLFGDAPLPVPQAEAAPAKRARLETDRVYVHRIAPSGASVVITGANGNRVFVQAMPAKPSADSGEGGLSSVRAQLTTTPIAQMMAAANQELHRKEVEAAVLAEEMDKENADGDEQSVARTPARAAQTESLWVDKYRPRKFTQLISDGKTNRNVLLWLTRWQNYIEGRGKDRNRRPKPAVKKAMTFSDGGGGGGGKGQPWDEPEQELDEDGRPAQKLLLLAGSPGLGKTTLAQVLGRHAGFEIVEINASDERTASALTERIENATQMRSVMSTQGKPCRPNCIILDEIDGALEGQQGKGAITQLLKLALATGKKKSSSAGKPMGAELDSSSRAQDSDDDNEEGGEEEEEVVVARGRQTQKKQKGRGKRGPPKLNRPIICICNNLWAPSLKALRDVACIYEFKPVSHLCACIGSLCLRQCVHGASIGRAACDGQAPGRDLPPRGAVARAQLAGAARGHRGRRHPRRAQHPAVHAAKLRPDLVQLHRNGGGGAQGRGQVQLRALEEHLRRLRPDQGGEQARQGRPALAPQGRAARARARDRVILEFPPGA